MLLCAREGWIDSEKSDLGIFQKEDEELREKFPEIRVIIDIEIIVRHERILASS